MMFSGYGQSMGVIEWERREKPHGLFLVKPCLTDLLPHRERGQLGKSPGGV